MNRVVKLAWLLAFTLMLYTGIARAITCTAAASSTSFGSYNTLSLVPLDSSGNVQVTCNGLIGLFVSYTISLSTGLSANYAARYMSNGANQLTYNLYTNAAHVTIWGDGTGGSSQVSDGYLIQLLFPVQRNYPVYGRIPASQNLPAGTYTDTIVVTVNY